MALSVVVGTIHVEGHKGIQLILNLWKTNCPLRHASTALLVQVNESRAPRKRWSLPAGGCRAGTAGAGVASASLGVAGQRGGTTSSPGFPCSTLAFPECPPRVCPGRWPKRDALRGRHWGFRLEEGRP